jgi:hypothetical protein
LSNFLWCVDLDEETFSPLHYFWQITLYCLSFSGMHDTIGNHDLLPLDNLEALIHSF